MCAKGKRKEVKIIHQPSGSILLSVIHMRNFNSPSRLLNIHPSLNNISMPCQMFRSENEKNGGSEKYGERTRNEFTFLWSI